MKLVDGDDYFWFFWNGRFLHRQEALRCVGQILGLNASDMLNQNFAEVGPRCHGPIRCDLFARPVELYDEDLGLSLLKFEGVDLSGT